MYVLPFTSLYLYNCSFVQMEMSVSCGTCEYKPRGRVRQEYLGRGVPPTQQNPDPVQDTTMQVLPPCL